MKEKKTEPLPEVEIQDSGELPEGWTWISLENAMESVIDYRGRTPPIVDYGIPHITTSNIREGKINWQTKKFVTPDTYEKYMTRGIPEQGDIFFTMEGPLGEVAVLHEKRKFSLAQRLLILRPRKDLFNGDFLACSLRSPQIQAGIALKATGSGVKGIAYKRLKDLQIPFPHLPEQQRIVARVEALITQVNAARERLNRVPLIMKKFRQAVLAAACEGRLTEGWREENRDVEEWRNVEFFDFCVLQRGYDLPLATCIEGPYPVVSSAGIVAYHKECKAKSPCVSVGRSGSIGNIFYIEKDFWPHNTALYVKDFKGNLPKFVYYYLRYFDPSKLSASTAVPTMNRNNLRGITIDIPSLAEQHEIVRRVGMLFERADSIDREVAAAGRRCERLTQAVLGKAFAGKL